MVSAIVCKGLSDDCDGDEASGLKLFADTHSCASRGFPIAFNVKKEAGVNGPVFRSLNCYSRAEGAKGAFSIQPRNTNCSAEFRCHDGTVFKGNLARNLGAEADTQLLFLETAQLDQVTNVIADCIVFDSLG
ncbi:hypothetical protein D3C87_1462850 [compost metagenome]